MELRRVVYLMTPKKDYRKRYKREFQSISKVILNDDNTVFVEFLDKQNVSRLSKKIGIKQRNNNTYFFCFEKVRYDVDLDFGNQEQLIGADGKNETLRSKGFYDRKIIRRPICPECSRSLRLGVRAVGHWTKIIKKNKTVSDYTMREYGLSEDQADFLYCTECHYTYQFFGKMDDSEKVDHFDDWYDFFKDDIKW